MVLDEGLVHFAVLDNVVGDVVQDRQIRARLEHHADIGQIEIAVLEGRQHRDPCMIRGQPAVGQAGPENRVHLGHVRAPEHEGIRLLKIVITAHRLVDAEGAHEGGDGRGHAVAGVRVEIVRQEAGLHQLDGGIAFPHGPLAGTEHADRSRALLLQGRLEFLGHDVEGFVPAYGLEFAVLVVFAVGLAQQGLGQPVAAIDDLGQEVTLDTVQPAVYGRVRVALGCDHAAVLGADQHAAAGAAKPAGRLVPADAGGGRLRAIDLRQADAGGGRGGGNGRCLDEIAP